MPVFLNPLFLGALAAVGIPVALHLLSRHRPHPVSFSAVRFLEEAVAQTRRLLFLSQLLLLLLRMLILALLALAFARPRLHSGNWLPSEARTVILVLDCTASMQAKNGDQSNFERARKWAGEVLDSLAERDRVALIAIGAPHARVVFPAISQHSRVRQALAELKCGFGANSIPAELRQIIQASGKNRENRGMEIQLFSDVQVSNWSERDAEGLGKLLKEKACRLFVNRLPLPAGNAGITRIRLNPPALLGAGRVMVTAKIQTGPQGQGANLLRLQVAGKNLAEQGLMLLPEAENRADLFFQAQGNATHLTGTLTLNTDVLQADNRRFFVMDRRPRLRVLLVEGGAATVENYRDAFYLSHALNPQELESPLIAAETLRIDQIGHHDFSRYDAIFLLNPPRVPANLALRLETYAHNGGTLVLYPGNRNGLNRRNLRKFKSLAKVKVAMEVLPEAHSFRLLHSRRPHELERRIARLFQRLPPISGSRRLVIKPPPLTGQRVFTLDNGAPLFYFRPIGRGGIWLCALAADRTWSEWPLSPVFVVLHQELVRVHAIQADAMPQTEIGGAAAIKWNGDEVELKTTLTTPDNQSQPRTLTRKSGAQPFVLTDLERPGLYRLQLHVQPPETRWIAVNVPAVESKWQQMTKPELAAQCAPAKINQSDTPAALRALLASLTRGHPLWPWLLLLAFLCAVAESLVSNFQSRSRTRPGKLNRLLRRQKL